MQIDLPFTEPSPEPPAEEPRIEFVRMRKARRYIMRVRPDGSLRVTIPRGGTKTEAIAFLGRHLSWIHKERARLSREQTPVRWTAGTPVLLDGVAHHIVVLDEPGGPLVSYAGRSVRPKTLDDVRPAIEADLKLLARERLVPRLTALARQHGLAFTRVSIRGQRSRWGSCSRSGAIALNFRLVQMPPEVCDYVLIHELMHLKQQNHGPRFWALVEAACPGYREAERWLRRSGRSLF